MSETINIHELLEGSAVYDDTANMDEVQVVILPEVTYVSYIYDANLWLHVWRCDNGEIEVDECGEPDAEYEGSDVEYHIIHPLIDRIVELDPSES